MKKRLPADNRFAFYHQNEALLFQFLLHECLQVHLLLKKKSAEKFLLLMGNYEETSRTANAPSGHLPRLQHFCTLLSTYFTDNSSKLCKNLQQTLDKAFTAAKKCYLTPDEQTQIKHYTALKKEIRFFMTLLFIKLYDFRDNPAVLLFLIKHQEQFDAFYKEPIIKKTLLTIFPEGIKEAGRFLSENFTKRGFIHLIPFIEQKLKALDVQPRAKRAAKG